MAQGLKPFFTYFGGKWRAALHYPEPLYETIIEPFAGSAGYSLRYPHKKVVLVEKDPVVSATWRYLIGVSEREILELPDIDPEGSVDDLPVCEEAKYLIGWWIQAARARPAKRPSAWVHRYYQQRDGEKHWSKRSCPTGGGPTLCWSRRTRERISTQLHAIRHWSLIEGDYTRAPDVVATWFVDPPYQEKGTQYRHGSDGIDYPRLARWCTETLSGQVIVCENLGADWLPFQPFKDIKSNEGYGEKVSKEVVYLRNCRPLTIWDLSDK